MKPFDFVAIALSLAVTALFTIQVFAAGSGAPAAEIQASGVTYLYALDDDQALEFDGPIGTTRIVISNGEVHVESSPCRDQICVNAGWLDAHPEWTACLPNRVILRVVAGDTDAGEPDAISF